VVFTTYFHRLGKSFARCRSASLLSEQILKNLGELAAGSEAMAKPGRFSRKSCVQINRTGGHGL
jgi:hypothetical protein